MTIFKPLKDRILVQQIDETITGGGIIIPDVAKDTPMTGIVIAVGSDVKDVAVGKTIIFPKFTWTRININGTSYLVMFEKDVLGFLE